MTPSSGRPFDAAPFGRSLEHIGELIWEDQREVHRVVVQFQEPPPQDLKLQYWRTRWPQQRLPKNAVPKGGAFGWWELGNWFTGQWQTADTVLDVQDKVATFTFRPVNALEFPDVRDFSATFRTTLKLRLFPTVPLPPMSASRTVPSPRSARTSSQGRAPRSSMPATVWCSPA